MVILRLTEKLLREVGSPTPTVTTSTTLLGDWTGALLIIGRRQFILLISEHSRLPVLMPVRDRKHLARRFPAALAPVLRLLSVPEDAVEREIEASREGVIARTNSRSLLGTLTDFSFLLSHYLRGTGEVDLVEAALWLSRTPVGPLGHQRPYDVARRLLGA